MKTTNDFINKTKHIIGLVMTTITYGTPKEVDSLVKYLEDNVICHANKEQHEEGGFVGNVTTSSGTEIMRPEIILDDNPSLPL